MSDSVSSLAAAGEETEAKQPKCHHATYLRKRYFLLPPYVSMLPGLQTGRRLQHPAPLVFLREDWISRHMRRQRRRETNRGGSADVASRLLFSFA